MKSISKVSNAPQSKSLRDLYERREQVIRAIQAIEQIQRMRSHRSPSLLPSLLALDRSLLASGHQRLAA